MPEGHTIHRLAADLGRDLVGHPLAASSPQGRFVDVARLDGKMLKGTEAVGKHLFLHFSAGTRALVVHVHLGLFGKFYRRKNPPPEARPTTRLRLSSASVTWDLVGPTRAEILKPAALRTLRDRLGADPLAAAIDTTTLDEAYRRFHASKRTVGALLLDQSIISGIGNVYRAEILFLLGIHPETRGCDLARSQFDAIWKLTRELLQRGVKEKRIATVPHAANVRLKRGEALHVYKRQKCRSCDAPIARIVLGARPIYACETCQPRLKA